MCLFLRVKIEMDQAGVRADPQPLWGPVKSQPSQMGFDRFFILFMEKDQSHELGGRVHRGAEVRFALTLSRQ